MCTFVCSNQTAHETSHIKHQTFVDRCYNWTTPPLPPEPPPPSHDNLHAPPKPSRTSPLFSSTLVIPFVAQRDPPGLLHRGSPPTNNSTSTHPNLPHTNPMESGLGNIVLAQHPKKNQKRFMSTDTEERRGHIFNNLHPPPPAHRLPQKSGFQGGGGGLGGAVQKLTGGCIFWYKTIILQCDKLIIQPLGVGHANRPRNPENWGVCGIF